MRKLIVRMTFVIGILVFQSTLGGVARAQLADPTLQVFVLCLDVNGGYTTYVGDIQAIEFMAPKPPSEGHAASTTATAHCLDPGDIAISGGYSIQPTDARGVSVTESVGIHGGFEDFWRVTVVRR